jgi:hypothetical protein
MATDGYEVTEVEEYVNPLTGRKSIEYILVPTSDKSRLKKWDRLPSRRIVERDGYEKWLKENEEHQIEFDLEGLELFGDDDEIMFEQGRRDADGRYGTENYIQKRLNEEGEAPVRKYNVKDPVSDD